MSVIKFKDMEEAIHIANSSKYGLTGAVFSSSPKVCHEVAKRVDCGLFSINNYFMIGHNGAFGGFKHSGIGRDLGPEGLDGYFESKTIMQDFN